MHRLMTRRRLLSTTAFAGFGAAAAASTRAASALSMTAASADEQKLYLQACSAKDGTYHRELVAEVKARLQGQATDQQIEAAIAATTCPICGCPIAAS
jgi:hypothetical protein